MSKTCSKNGCENPVFSMGYCRAHQWMRTDSGYKKQKTFAKKKIPKESQKRIEEKKTYKQVKDELREELISQGKYNCTFCTLPMGAEKGFHHYKGRDGSLYIDKKYLAPGHNQCHVWDYHQARIEDLIKQPWYSGFLARLKELDEELYFKELKKQDKNLRISFE